MKYRQLVAVPILLLKLLFLPFKYTWYCLIFIIELIDSDEESEVSLPSNYNYRTGKVDLTRLDSGLYDDDI